MLNINTESFIVLVFTVFAAITSAIMEKNRKNNKNKPADDGHVLINKAFQELQSTIEELRTQLAHLKEECNDLKAEVDIYREKYYNQIEINNVQSSQLTKLKLNMLNLMEDKKIDLDDF